MLLRAEDSCLLVVDVQERLVPVMSDPRAVLKTGAFLMRAARRLDVSIVVSEHLPEKIGPTMFDLRELAPPDSFVSKCHFSCAHEPAVLEHLNALGKRQIVLCGTEAHVCVLQSALGLKAEGFDVYCVTDACGSRNPANAQAAYERMRMNGVTTMTAEMAVFEWLNRADTQAFKDLIPHIKAM
ncbi:hydrolase [Telmatospirillum sp. J64-1]|uniref:hydrolase n=1 Tax=Telmatospirillum sp. J64-1 TaxID=2502183 RepID=UPI00115E0246|nr:hydrolase [Telmatospirillum sp. J64-1]